MRNLNSQILQECAGRLELQVATSHLLTHLFPESDEIGGALGRYKFLQRVIERRPKLLQALLDGKRESIQREWSQVLVKHKSDARFLHGLAVMYREQALASEPKGQMDEHQWIFSNTLWISLLSTKEFWDYFSEARFSEHNNRDQTPLDPKQENKLFRKAFEGILSLHSTHGRRDFAAGRYEQARVYLHCLDLCRTGGEALAVTLDDYRFSCNLDLDDDRLKHVMDMAGKLIDDWGNTLVRDAEKMTEDAEAIRNLPKGIRKNYGGGIDCLEAFIKLNIPVVRVLRTTLNWYNDWCYDLYVTEDIERIRTLMGPACVVAKQLAPECTKGHGHTPENQALSQHFLLRGFSSDGPEHAIEEYRKALAWNPANDNAQSLLDGSTQETLKKQLKTAIDCMEQGRFTEAYKVLDAVEEQAKDKEQVNEARALVCFRHANDLANDGKFQDALQLAQEAQELQPSHPVIEEFVADIEELALEEDNLQHLRNAEKEFEEERYDRTIQAASQVSLQSKFSNRAHNLQAVAYFHQGINAAHQERFVEAETYLKNALGLNNNKKERKVIQKQLSQILNARAVNLLNESQLYLSYETKRDVLRLLEEAVKLDPSNGTAKQNLKTVKKVM